MRTRVLIVAIAALLAGCDAAETGQKAAAPIVVVDDAGRAVSLARPARRVVALLPAATETMVALGAADRLVGRTRYDTAAAVAELPSVGGGLDPSLEVLVSLAPDLVIAWEAGSDGELRRRLEQLGVAVFSVATRDTADVLALIGRVGELVGEADAAAALSERVRGELAAVVATVPSGPRPSVLYVLSLDPPLVAGTGNFLAELIGVAGGEPVALAAELEGRSPQVSLERILREDPDVLLMPVGEDAALSRERLVSAAGWRELRAVRRGQVATVPADLVHRPGPRIGEAARALREAIRSAAGRR